MNSTRRRRAGRYAWLAALTVTVMTVSPLLAIFHQISARHAVCEHGQFVESGENRRASGAGIDGERGARDEESAPTSALRPESDATLHPHSHCSVGTLAKNHIGLLPGTQVVTALSEIAAERLHHCEFAYVRAILLSAPKTSPPHAAS